LPQWGVRETISKKQSKKKSSKTDKTQIFFSHPDCNKNSTPKKEGYIQSNIQHSSKKLVRKIATFSAQLNEIKAGKKESL